MENMDKKIFMIAAMGFLLAFLATENGNAAPRKKMVSLVRKSAASANTAALTLDVIPGCPTDASVTLNFLSGEAADVYYKYGTTSGAYRDSTAVITRPAGEPLETVLKSLLPDTRYYYRALSRESGTTVFQAGDEHTFHTQRARGGAFTFCIQGDSHPERLGKMFDPDLYLRTMNNVVKDLPDFYFTIGDDFSIERLIEGNLLSQAAVDSIYMNQRPYLGIIGKTSPLFLVNGNHEQAAQYLLNGTPDNAAVFAAKARTKFYPLPAPDDFYSGNSEAVQFAGLLRDYYAFEWGDALFVVIDPYWHSSVPVDNVAGTNGDKRTDLWDITLGKAQYDWLKRTLEQSGAKYKFVFSHHVLGTGRGGIEMAGFYEWGGKGKDGIWEFDARRPGWELPIHQLMVKNGVSIFFFGHDHLFARQVLDGIVYQSLPNPADPTYTAFNADAYRSGDILPNSGHLRVAVSGSGVTVEYVRSFLPNDETDIQKHGAVTFSYTVGAQVDSAGIRSSPLLGRPTGSSVAVNAISGADGSVYFEYGTSPGVYSQKTETKPSSAGEPLVQVMGMLSPVTRYYSVCAIALRENRHLIRNRNIRFILNEQPAPHSPLPWRPIPILMTQPILIFSGRRCTISPRARRTF